MSNNKAGNAKHFNNRDGKKSTQTQGKGKFFKNQDKLPNKRDREAAEIGNTAVRMSRSNPISFYDKYSDYVKEAAKVPFANPLGTIYHDWSDYSTEKPYSIPGVMRILFIPVPGVCKDFTDPLNKSAMEYWTYLRSVMRAAADYDFQDIVIHLLMVDSLYSFWKMLERVYGLTANSTPLNLYYPESLINACGISFSDLHANIDDFRAYVDQFGISLSKLAIPGEIEFIKRHAWMNEGIYVDSETTRAQTYIFVQAGFWKFQKNATTQAGELIYTQWIDPASTSATSKKFSDIVTFGDALLNAVRGDQDTAQISGDLYNLYGSKVLTVHRVTPGYQILPKYDRVVLSQIENLTLVPMFSTPGSTTIGQSNDVDKGAIIFDPNLVSIIDTRKDTDRLAMNFHWDKPTAEDVIEASRLMSTIRYEGVNKRLGTCGSEIVVGLDIFRVNPATGGIQSNPIRSQWWMFNSNTDWNTIRDALYDIMLVGQFDWAPQVRVVDNSTSNQVLLGTTWDTDVFGYLKSDYLTQINNGCLWSEFAIPKA